MKCHRLLRSVFVLTLFVASTAMADAVTDWNARTGEIVTAAALGTPPANRLMAIAHTAAYEAANAITTRYPSSGLQLEAAKGASVDAAIAAAHRAVFTQLVPSQRAAIDTAYRAALSQIGDAGGVQEGIAVGERAAAALLAARASDGAATPETYRPQTVAGPAVSSCIFHGTVERSSGIGRASCRERVFRVV